jgi:branched-chain amino acid transport system ATP-binding protein
MYYSNVSPTSGSVLFEGQRVSGRAPERMAELGIARTFQNGRVFGNMSVRDNVLVGMHPHLTAVRPLPALRHIPGGRWISLLAETAMALVRPPSVRREEREIREQAVQQ